jgi:polyhydroxyalkanoate synthase
MDGEKTGLEFPDMEQASNQMAAFAERSSRIVQAFMRRQNNVDDYQVSDPFVIGQAFMDLAAEMIADPAKLAQAQTQLMQGYMDLWTQTAKRMQGETAEPVVAPAAARENPASTWGSGTVAGAPCGAPVPPGALRPLSRERGGVL